MKPIPFDKTVLDITYDLFSRTLHMPLPDAVNINLYEDGSQMVGWHSDDEPLFDSDDVRIYSLTFGSGRDFQLVRKDLRQSQYGKYKRPITPDPKDIVTVNLADGDLLGMAGLTQRHYDHQISKSIDGPGPRINLTWRYIRKHCTGCTAIQTIDSDID